MNCSPDSIKINPIEYLWNGIKRELYDNGKFRISKEYIWGRTENCYKQC